MKRRLTSVVTPIAHLIGPGQVKVINQRLAFNAHDAKPVRLDPAALTCVLCYGSVGITDEALRVLLANDIAVAFLTPAGNRCRGRLVGGNSATALTRLAQIAALADPQSNAGIRPSLRSGEDSNRNSPQPVTTSVTASNRPAKFDGASRTPFVRPRTPHHLTYFEALKARRRRHGSSYSAHCSGRLGDSRAVFDARRPILSTRY